MERILIRSWEGLQVPCRIYDPGYGGITRGVVGVHGLTGSKDSPILAAIREEMGLYQAASVTFDLPGHGESPMSTRDLNLENCRARGMKKVLITCHRGNIASEKTILANGGVFDGAVSAGEDIIHRFWITL